MTNSFSWIVQTVDQTFKAQEPSPKASTRSRFPLQPPLSSVGLQVPSSPICQQRFGKFQFQYCNLAALRGCDVNGLHKLLGRTVNSNLANTAALTLESFTPGLDTHHPQNQNTLFLFGNAHQEDPRPHHGYLRESWWATPEKNPAISSRL